MALFTIARWRQQRGEVSGSPFALNFGMRKFLVIAVLAGLAWLFVIQKRNDTSKPAVSTQKTTGQTVAATSPRPVSEHNWMKRSLDRTNEVKRQVAQQRREDGAR